jgi:hypothetical protein
MFMKKKSEMDKKIKQYREFIKTQHGKRCKTFRFDGGGEYILERLKKQLKDEGICIEMTAPYSPSQNGVAERSSSEQEPCSFNTRSRSSYGWRP